MENNDDIDNDMNEEEVAQEQAEENEEVPSYFLSEPIQCASIRQDNFVMINGNPCQILKTPEITLQAMDILSGEMIEFKCLLNTNFTVPLVTSEYYQVLYITEDDFLHLKPFSSPAANSMRGDLSLPPGPLGQQIRDGFYKPHSEVYVTVIQAFGQERIMFVKCCSAFPDFERLPNEMKEKIFDFLKVPDLLNVRQVCKSWEWVTPISTLVRIHLMKIFCGRISMRIEPSQDRDISAGVSRWKTVSPSSLSEAPIELLYTVRHLELRERMDLNDLQLVLNHCHRLHTIDLDYPTDETMEVLPKLIENSQKTLETFSIWDYFWYNSEKDAFDCQMMAPCLRLTALTLFVKYVKGFNHIPRTLTILKLDKISLDDVRWIVENMLELKLLRIEIAHYHQHVVSSSLALLLNVQELDYDGSDEDADAMGDVMDELVEPEEAEQEKEQKKKNSEEKLEEMDETLLKSLCALPKIEKLDLNFAVTKTILEDEAEPQFGPSCPMIKEFEILCNATEGIIAVSETWDINCTLEIMVKRPEFVGFD